MEAAGGNGGSGEGCCFNPGTWSGRKPTAKHDPLQQNSKNSTSSVGSTSQPAGKTHSHTEGWRLSVFSS